MFFFSMMSLERINHNCIRFIYDYKAAALEGVAMSKNTAVVIGQDIISERCIPLFENHSPPTQTFYAVFPKRRDLPEKTCVSRLHYR